MKQTAVRELISEMEQLKETKLYTGSFKAIEDCLCLAYAKLEMEKQQKGFSEDDVNLAFFLGKKDDHVRLHKLINSRLGQLKSE
jgi:hypothetical protein